MAVGARSELESLEHLVRVAAFTRDGLVRSDQGESRLCVIELAAEILERRLRGVARRAVLSKRALVYVGVARRTSGGQRQERPHLVASRALGRHGGMLAVSEKPVTAAWSKLPHVERPQLAVDAGMLRVTGRAIGLHVLVHSHPPRNPVGDRRMARQALRRSHLLPLLVTLLTVRDPLELCMGLRQLPRRQQCAKLSFGAARTRGPHEERHCRCCRQAVHPPDRGSCFVLVVATPSVEVRALHALAVTSETARSPYRAPGRCALPQSRAAGTPAVDERRATGRTASWFAGDKPRGESASRALRSAG